MLHRLVGGSILAQEYRVVGEHVHHRELRQRAQPDGGPGVVGEHQEGGHEGSQPAVVGDAIGDGGHGVLAHAEVQVAAAVVLGPAATPLHRAQRTVRALEVPGAWERCVGGGVQVCRPAHQPRHTLGQRPQRRTRRGAGGHPLTRGIGRQALIPPLRQLSALSLFPPGREVRVGLGVRAEPLLPRCLQCLPARPRLTELPQRLFRYHERLRVRPAQVLFGTPDLVLAQRRSVRLEPALLARTAEGDAGADDHEGRPPALFPGLPDGGVHGLQVVAVRHLLHVPAQGLEPAPDVLGEREGGTPREAGAVRVVQADELAQAQVPGQGRRLVGHALHEVAVGGHHVRPVVHDLVPGSVEGGRQVALRHGHAHRVREPLPQWPRGALHPGGEAKLRVAGGPAAPLSELLEVVQREIVPAQVQQRVQQHGRVARGQHEPVAVGPQRVTRVVAQEAGPQDVRGRCEAHGSARVS
ncbi:hypothetical protein HRbin32_00621 [bacterium HR32]|nr:hypothetical protein HRbin32_00621 [bacterium HR32]